MVLVFVLFILLFGYSFFMVVDDCLEKTEMGLNRLVFKLSLDGSSEIYNVMRSCADTLRRRLKPFS